MQLTNASDWTASFPHPFGTDPVGDTATLNRFMESVNQRLNQIAHGQIGSSGSVAFNRYYIRSTPGSLVGGAGMNVAFTTVVDHVNNDVTLGVSNQTLVYSKEGTYGTTVVLLGTAGAKANAPNTSLHVTLPGSGYVNPPAGGDVQGVGRDDTNQTSIFYTVSRIEPVWGPAIGLPGVAISLGNTGSTTITFTDAILIVTRLL